MKQESRILDEAITYIEDELGAELSDICVERAVLGLFFTGVKLNTGNGGLSFTPIKEIPEAVCCPSSAAAMPLSGKLDNRSAREYLKDVSSTNVLKKALGIAALNALSDYCINKNTKNDFEILYGVDAFDIIDIAQASQAVVVGALAPMLKRLIKEKIPFHVLEMDVSTLKEHEMPYYLPPDKAPACVPEADLLVITGTTLLNDTLEGLLHMAKPGAQIVVTGPTASVVPDPFFRRGVTLLGGISVTNPNDLLDIISEGGSGYHFFGKSAERTVLRKK